MAVTSINGPAATARSASACEAKRAHHRPCSSRCTFSIVPWASSTLRTAASVALSSASTTTSPSRLAGRAGMERWRITIVPSIEAYTSGITLSAVATILASHLE